MLPIVKKVPLQREVFPQKWQTVIFRNYGLVSADKIAKTLSMSASTLEIEAERLGLPKGYQPLWEKKGFITLIRNNWFLLPYEQIKTLLGYDDARLEFILENEDFLHVKLGDVKPYCEEVKYFPLSDEEIKQTNALAEKIKGYLATPSRPFDFFAQDSGERKGSIDHGEGIRLIHGYLTPCGDAFMEDGEDYLPDALLERYQSVGVNGVWVHGLLAALSPYPFRPALSKDYQTRRKNMQRLVDRAAKYGIKVYLYFNEPRGMAVEDLGEYAHLKGTVQNGYAHLCFEQKEVQEYLYTAIKDLFSEVKGLGGAITITMSENPTHCHSNSHKNCNCPVCKDIPPEKTAAAVNNVIAKALRDSGSGAKVLAYLWGWSSFKDWTDDQVERGISYLDEDIIAVCASEYGVQFEKGGIKSEVIDYSISNPGPSPLTTLSFKAAQGKGMRTCAKIQTNNSWECSATPYLPVFELVLQHLENLHNVGVHDYMLTWTLGGYPSPVLDLIAEYAENPNGFSVEKWYQKNFGQEWEKVREASKHFCEGLKEYPFSIDSLYFAPKTLGPANLWDLEAEGKSSSMVCFSFDDYETWIQPYPYPIYISQFEKLLKAWGEGLELLKDAKGQLACEVKTCAEVAYLHFKSDLLHTQFAYCKRDKEKNKQQLIRALQEERANAEGLLSLFIKMPAVGFEASNHYYYNERNLVEKILQTSLLQSELE